MGEIVIRHAVGLSGAESLQGERFVPAWEILHAIELAQARGCGRLLLVIDSLGGRTNAAILLYDALTRFRAAGGRVVAYVDGIAVSAATLFALAADAIVAAPRATFGVHGPVDGRTGAPADDARWECDRAIMLAVYASRTLTARTRLERWLSLPARRADGDYSRPHSKREPLFEKFDARTAVRLGWADAIGGRDVALRFLCAAELPASERRRGLVQRDEWRPELRELHARAEQLRLPPPPVVVMMTEATPPNGENMKTLPSPSSNFICRAQFEEVPPNAMVPGPWVPSAQNIVLQQGIGSQAVGRTEILSPDVLHWYGWLNKWTGDLYIHRDVVGRISCGGRLGITAEWLSAPVSAGQLPSGWRPSAVRYYRCFDSSGSNAATVQIDTNGYLTFTSGPAGVEVYLDGVSFMGA